MPTTAAPLLLTDPGYLFTAPVLTSFPTNTVAGSIFTDAWTAPWVSLGATADGADFNYTTKVAPIFAAEFLDPLKYATTERSGSIAFNLLDWVATRWKQALNGGTMTLVSGTGATALTSITPPTPGSEVRAMIGWESLDHTARIVIPQAINGADIKTSFKKAPAVASIAVDFQFEIPASGLPFTVFMAGATRGA